MRTTQALRGVFDAFRSTVALELCMRAHDAYHEAAEAASRFDIHESARLNGKAMALYALAGMMSPADGGGEA